MRLGLVLDVTEPWLISAVDYVDLYYLHRCACSCNRSPKTNCTPSDSPDQTVPIEITMDALKQLVQCVFSPCTEFLSSSDLVTLRIGREGKIRYIGLSECSAATVRRAHAIHPVSALQVEYSVFTLDIEHPDVDILRTARELGIAIIAYSPLGRGLLTGRYVCNTFTVR